MAAGRKRKGSIGKPASGQAGALDLAGFHLRAQDSADLAPLTALFDTVIADIGVTGHHCFRLDRSHYAEPLFGTAPQHCASVVAASRKGILDTAASIAWVAETGLDDTALLAVMIPSGGGTERLVVTFGFPASTPQPDRAIKARLHGLAAVYAMRGFVLWESEDDTETTVLLTLKERIALSMLLVGNTPVDIAERLECSVPAAMLHVDKAAAKLGAADAVEATAIAARQGWLHSTTKIAPRIKGIDR